MRCTYQDCPHHRLKAGEVNIIYDDDNQGTGYDHPRFHWPRFWERVLSSLVNAVIYGGGIVLLRAIGLL